MAWETVSAMSRRTRFARRTRTDLWGPSGGACASFLLAIALLLCHGVFGAEHLTISYQSGATDHVERSPLTTVEGEPGEWPPLDGEGDAAYYATFLAALLLLAAVLGPGLPLVPCGVRGYRGSPCRPRRVPPPRGPTAPLLQVFRL